MIITVLAMAWHIYASGCTVRASIATDESTSLVFGWILWCASVVTCMEFIDDVVELVQKQLLLGS